jgi:protein phosphatase
MGGVKGGAIASRIAVETLKKMYDSKRPDLADKDAVQDWLQEAVAEANKNICEESETISGPRMGTTIVVAVQPDEGDVLIAHVGDSRAYMLKNGSIEPVTSDHSVVMEMMRKDKLTPEQCRTNPFRHLLTRCLGHDRDVEIDKTQVECDQGNWMVLCSDGLSSVLSDEEIGSTISDCESAEEVCQMLLAKTLEAGAPDNVTIVTVKYDNEGSENTCSDAIGELNRTSASAASAE